MAKRYSGNEFVSVTSATQCFSSARIVIADNAIAVGPAGSLPGAANGALPTGDTKEARRDGSIIAIASGRTGAACVKRNHG